MAIEMIRTLDELYQPIQEELDRVRVAVTALWGETLSLIHGATEPSPQTGGKLLRPALCLLSAGAAGAQDIGRFVPIATAAEILHMAALTHDDIVDKAALRRGNVTLNSRWDDRTAVLSGDYLVSRAVLGLTRYGSAEIVQSTFEAMRHMTEGELASLGNHANGYTQEDCLRLAEQKTATFFAATCAMPTYIEGECHREALHEFGIALGVAFQLIDDVLDIAKDQKSLGKPTCGDIVEGKKTLPILFMQEDLEPADVERLKRMKGHAISDDDRAWAATMLEQSQARARTEAMAREYIDNACAALESLPPSIYKESMLGLAEFVLIRGS